MAELIKEFGQLGIGMGALVALIIVIMKQLELIKSMQTTIDTNTKATVSLKESVDNQVKISEQTNQHLMRAYAHKVHNNNT